MAPGQNKAKDAAAKVQPVLPKVGDDLQYGHLLITIRPKLIFHDEQTGYCVWEGQAANINHREHHFVNQLREEEKKKIERKRLEHQAEEERVAAEQEKAKRQQRALAKQQRELAQEQQRARRERDRLQQSLDNDDLGALV